MKKLFWGTLLLSLTLTAPFSARAGVDVGISIALPQPIVFAAPPVLIVLPETYIYVVPGIEEEIFFYNGWWWRPWEGHWYRSRDYDSDWSLYQEVPAFYRQIPPDWRNAHREHRWKGNQWDYQEIPHQRMQQNWDSWQKDKYWEKQSMWGVHGLQHQEPSHTPAQDLPVPQNMRNNITPQGHDLQETRQQERDQREKNEKLTQKPTQEVQLPQHMGNDIKPKKDSPHKATQQKKNTPEKNEKLTQKPTQEAQLPEHMGNDNKPKKDSPHKATQQKKNTPEKNEKLTQEPAQEAQLPQHTGNDNKPQKDDKPQPKQQVNDSHEKNEKHNRK